MGVINAPIKSSAKNYSLKNSTVRIRIINTKNCVHWKLKFLQVSYEISVLLIAALGFKWNPLWHWISILDDHLGVHIRRAISHSHITYAETVPSWFLLNLKVVQVTWNILYIHTGCPKKIARIRRTQNPYSGCSHIGFSFLSWKQPIIHVLSEVMKRKTVELDCFVITLRYQRTVSFLIETILSVFISTVKYQKR